MLSSSGWAITTPTGPRHAYDGVAVAAMTSAVSGATWMRDVDAMGRSPLESRLD